jgi:hypothetical protein
MDRMDPFWPLPELLMLHVHVEWLPIGPASCGLRGASCSFGGRCCVYRDDGYEALVVHQPSPTEVNCRRWCSGCLQRCTHWNNP